MSSLTLSQLLASDPVPFDEAGQAWLALARALDDGFEQLVRGSRDLEYAWPQGAAASAGQARLADTRAELNSAYNPARRIGQALLHHGAAVTDLREQLRATVEGAAKSGFVVDLGAVTVTPVPRRHPDPAAATGAAQQIADALSQLLGRARALDDSTANALGVNLPQPGTGFGRLSLPPVSRDVLLAQRGRTPKQVDEWWHSLTPEQQERAIADFPELVGWLDGVPATDRDTANRIRLDRDTDRLAAEQRRLADREAYIRDIIAQGRGVELYPDTPNPLGTATVELDRLAEQRAGVDTQLSGLRQVSTALDRLGDKGLLLGVDPAGDGKAIIAVGNPDTAAHTGVWVPGLGTELTDTLSNVERVRNLQEAALGMVPASDGVATVMWLGYDAPEPDLSVVGSERSRQGGIALDGFVDGLRATHDGDGRITAVGHSYGSTVVAEAALRGNGLAVDDIVTAGSPGMHTPHAQNFVGINAQHVWAGSAADDPVSDAAGHRLTKPVAGALTAVGLGSLAGEALLAYEAGHGPSPHRESFGANQYMVDTTGHSDYWRDGTESLKNQARVVVGQYAEVGLVHGHVPTTFADDPPPAPPPPGVVPTPAPPATPPATAPGTPSPTPQPAPAPRPTP